MSDANANPLTGFTYRLDLAGKVSGYFTECSGLGSENEVIEHKVVDDSGHELVQKVPGRLKWGDITLKRGITDSMDVWEWRKTVEQGQMSEARAEGSIHMLDRAYEDVASWDFHNAWPSKVSGPSLSAGSNDIGIEEITIVHEGIERTK